jgi:hypothetical protein
MSCRGFISSSTAVHSGRRLGRGPARTRIGSARMRDARRRRNKIICPKTCRSRLRRASWGDTRRREANGAPTHPNRIPKRRRPAVGDDADHYITLPEATIKHWHRRSCRFRRSGRMVFAAHRPIQTAMCATRICLRGERREAQRYEAHRRRSFRRTAFLRSTTPKRRF